MDMNAYRKLADEIHKARKKAEDAKAKAEVYRDTLLKGIEEYEKTYNVVLLKDKSVSDAELLRVVGSSLAAERTKVDGLTQKIADRYTEILNTDYTKLPEEAGEEPEVAEVESSEEASEVAEVEDVDTPVEEEGAPEVEEEAVEPAKVAQESEPEVAPGIVGEQVFTQSEDDVPDMLDIDVVEEEKPAPKSEGKAMSFADMLNESKTTEDPFDGEDDGDTSEETNTEEDDVVTDEDELFFKNMGIDF